MITASFKDELLDNLERFINQMKIEIVTMEDD